MLIKVIDHIIFEGKQMDSILTTKKGENNSIYRKELTYFYDFCQKSDRMNVYQ